MTGSCDVRREDGINEQRLVASHDRIARGRSANGFDASVPVILEATSHVAMALSIPLEFLYEYLKDFRTYFLILALVYWYGFVIRRFRQELRGRLSDALQSQFV